MAAAGTTLGSSGLGVSGTAGHAGNVRIVCAAWAFAQQTPVLVRGCLPWSRQTPTCLSRAKQAFSDPPARPRRKDSEPGNCLLRSQFLGVSLRETLKELRLPVLTERPGWLPGLSVRAEGFEPSITAPKAAALPLGYALECHVFCS